MYTSLELSLKRKTFPLTQQKDEKSCFYQNGRHLAFLCTEVPFSSTAICCNLTALEHVYISCIL